MKWVRRFLIVGWFIGMVMLTIGYGLDFGTGTDGMAPFPLLPMMHTDATSQLWYDYTSWMQGCAATNACESGNNQEDLVEPTPLADEHAYSRDTKAIRVVPHLLTP